MLEQRLTDLHASFRRLQQDVTEQVAAIDAQGDLETALGRERAARVALEQQLASHRKQYEVDLARASAVRAMIDEQLREAALEVERARQTEASAAAEVERLARQEADLTTRYRQETVTRAALEQRVADVEAALTAANEEISFERAAAAERAAGRQAAYQAEIEHEIAKRRGVEELLARAQSAQAAAAEQQAQRDAELAAQLNHATASHHALERQLSDVVAAMKVAETRANHERQRAAEQYAETERTRAELAQAAAALGDAQRQLADAEARVSEEVEARDALDRVVEKMRAAAADAERRFLEEIAALSSSARAERERLEERHRAAMADAAARFAEREARFTAELTSLATVRDGLARQLADAEGRLTGETAKREELERLADEARVERERLVYEQEQLRGQIGELDQRLAQREARFEAERAAIAATRTSLEQQLGEIEAALTQETATRERLEQAIAQLQASAADADRRHREESARLAEEASAERTRYRQQLAAVEQRLADECAAREGLEQALTDTRGAAADAQRRHLQETARLAEDARSEQARLHAAISGVEQRLTEREAQFATELAALTATRIGLEQQLDDVNATLTQEIERRAGLERAMAAMETASADAERRFKEEIAALTAAAAQAAAREAQLEQALASANAARDGLADTLKDVEARFTRETRTRESLERVIIEIRSAAACAEQQFQAQATALTERAQAEQTRLREQIAREKTAFAERLAERGAEFERELERLAQTHAIALADVEAALAQSNAKLDEQTACAASLQSRLDTQETENRRQFEQTPVPLVRCARNGAVTGANQAFATLVGCRTANDVRDADFGGALFESRDDLIWLIDRVVRSNRTESIETTCTKKDGTRVAVRLSARPSASSLVEIAAEDLTAVRVLEDRLREAHRMESVGRLASEVAVTCGRMLHDVYRDGQQLLATMSGSTADGERMETLLDDVTRAGSYLHQLVAYGQEQAAALAPVDLNTILRELEPVLRDVAGDAITLELRKTSSPITIDIKADRVERLLVNVASYGRQRMPQGGRLKIELSTVVVDGTFIAQYPNVRQGPHALITVTEVARAGAADTRSNEGDSAASDGFVTTRPGVDLGALQELIAECGGHLWITAEPGGSMVVKMRLPLRAAWDQQAQGRKARKRFGLSSLQSLFT